MISFVTFLWRTGFRDYRPEQVNMLARAVKHFYPHPHRFICVSDDTQGFSADVEVIPMPRGAKRVASLEAPQGKQFPSSYRRLWCFSKEAEILGEKIMLLDIDALIVGPLASLVDVDGDFVGWRPISIWGREDRIGGGTWMLKTGKLTWLWEQFLENPTRMIAETKELGWTGSDQAVMSRYLHKKYPKWSRFCGIYGSQDGVFQWERPPDNAIIVHFNGQDKPWSVQKPWIRAYCRYFGGDYAAQERLRTENDQQEYTQIEAGRLPGQTVGGDCLLKSS